MIRLQTSVIVFESSHIPLVRSAGHRALGDYLLCSSQNGVLICLDSCHFFNFTPCTTPGPDAPLFKPTAY